MLFTGRDWLLKIVPAAIFIIGIAVTIAIHLEAKSHAPLKDKYSEVERLIYPKIRLTVQDMDTGKPIDKTNILITPKAQYQLQSDRNGNANRDLNLADIPLEVLVQKKGYRQKTKTFLPKEISVPLTIDLKLK